MATTRDSRSQSKGETHVPITADHVRKVFKGLENGDGAMGAGHSLSDKAFIDRMFAGLGSVLPQGAQLHNESTTTGKEKSDGSSR